ncbi:MAG TPA: hypothetical protein EYP78_05930 [Candidatus Omnitrophica bacterium]|nr:hypothetical protein [Candidatus Omnitrophota bacterium]
MENFHGRIEKEFYQIEPIKDEEELLSKSFSYILYYNTLRSNMGNKGKTPREVVKEDFPDIPSSLFYLPSPHPG